MKILKNLILDGNHSKPIITDVFYKEQKKPKPVIIFSHGYKGFKDWGAWNLMANVFAEAGFFFIKFNFSHNGGTAENPIDFPDLEAFGNNNYTKELDDLETVVNWISTNDTFRNEVDKNSISLIGHSRGGGIVLIKAKEDNRIKNVITLAGISDYGKRSSTSGDLENWKKNGVKYVLNGRTKQQMPHFYQFYENFKANEERLYIKRAVENLKIPQLIIHGDADIAVSIDEAYLQHQWNKKSELCIIKNADHVFNTAHPWQKDVLSTQLQEVITICIGFLRK